jgi:hypothetical protein
MLPTRRRAPFNCAALAGAVGQCQGTGADITGHVMKTEFYGNVGYKANFEDLIRELSPLPA